MYRYDTIVNQGGGDGVMAVGWVPSALVSDIETGLVAPKATRLVAPAGWAGDAHVSRAITRAAGDSAAIVALEDLVSEVGW